MKIIISCLVASLVFLGGCAATVTEAGYYWGDYSQTLYKYTLDPNEDTLAEHTEELNNIIDKSRELGLRVPPGIHAELGYIRARQGDNAQATAYYETEMSLYPESRLFLERLTATTTKGSN
jgi:hypothetical protein